MKKTLYLSLTIVVVFSVVISAFAVSNNYNKDNTIVTQFTLSQNYPDTSITLEDNKVVTHYYNEELSKESELKLILKNGLVKDAYLDGKKLSKKERENYRKEINFTLTTLDKAKRQADKEKINKEVEQALHEIESIDWKEINESIELAMKEIEDIDFGAITVELEKLGDLKELEELEYLKSDEFREEIERSISVAMEVIEDIEMPEIPDIDGMLEEMTGKRSGINEDINQKNVETEKEQNLEEKLRELNDALQY